MKVRITEKILHPKPIAAIARPPGSEEDPNTQVIPIDRPRRGPIVAHILTQFSRIAPT